MRNFLLALALVFAASPVSAQITVPNTLTAGQVIRAADLNTNFSTLADKALNRILGGSIEGNVTLLANVTMDGVDISDYLLSTGEVHSGTAGTVGAPSFSRTGDTNTGVYFPAADELGLVVSGVEVFKAHATGITAYGVNIINAVGKIPALTSTYFASLDGSTLTNLSAANLTGSIADARLSANVPLKDAANTFSASNTFSAATTFSALNTFTALGTHLFTSGGVGSNRLDVINTTDGVGNSAQLRVTAGTTSGLLYATAQSYTTGTYDVQASTVLQGDGAGGVSLVASTGALRFYAGGSTLRGQFTSAGNWSLGTAGNITDAVSTPTITSGAGTGATILGRAYAFTVTIGTGATGPILVSFGSTWTNKPTCVAGADASSSVTVRAEPTTTQVELFSSGYTSGVEFQVICRGY